MSANLQFVYKNEAESLKINTKKQKLLKFEGCYLRPSQKELADRTKKIK